MPESSVQELEELPPDAAIAADHRNPRRRSRERQREEEPEVGALVHPESRHELAGLILHRGVKQQILDGLRAIRRVNSFWQAVYPNIARQITTAAITPARSAQSPAASAWRVRRTATEPK